MTVKLIRVALEEVAGVAFFAGGGCFPQATDCEVEEFESAVARRFQMDAAMAP